MPKFVSILIWTLISLLGAGAVAGAAFRRGEPINALWLVVAGVCTFAVAYRFYSAWLMAKVLTLDPDRAPPALTKNDGKDFVPTAKWVVFGHHFAAIAGPGPLVGPVLAAQFGYLPGTLWLLIGATLGGGVHDAVVLFASMRRDGKSLGQMIKEELNPVLGVISMVCLIAIMTILLAVLGAVVVKALAESPWGLFTIAMTIPLAMLMGLALKIGRMSVGLVSLLGVLGLFVCVWGGEFIHKDPELHKAWLWAPADLAWAIIIYGFAASVLPVWLLLAPRDYLSTFMKLGTVAVLGLFIIIVAPPLKMPAINHQFINGGGWIVPGPVFPFVCITIACGAISGFHALISSGTTPKLLMREKDIRLVGYGSMVTEMLVALSAIIAACAMEPGIYFAMNTGVVAGDPASVSAALAKINAAGFPVTQETMTGLATQLGEPNLIGKTGGAPTFAVGMAMMFSKVIGEKYLSYWYHFAIMFEALFILTTLDAGSRVGRFILQDLLGGIWAPLRNTANWGANAFATLLLVSGWGYFLYQGSVDPAGIAKSLWPIFGISNQLLAVIAFCLGTTIIIKMGKARYAWCTLLPMLYLTCVTFTAGIMKLYSPRADGFYPALPVQEGKIAAAETALAAAKTAGEPGGVEKATAALKTAKSGLTNLYVDIGITWFFLIGVAVIVGGSIWLWINLLLGRKKAELQEGKYVPLSEAEAQA